MIAFTQTLPVKAKDLMLNTTDWWKCEERLVNKIQALKKKLEEIDQKILETEKHLPAHSVKPPIMQEIFALIDTMPMRLHEMRRQNS